MEFQDYLLKNQKLVYNTFLSSLKHNKISHAYLITGDMGAPLLETAKFLAKTLICEDLSPLACEKCMSCIRFDEGNFNDFILIDGSKANIKVDDIETLQKFCQKTPSELSGKMIYIIHLLENSNKESLNAILKFLEEPSPNVYAFITTFNKDKLLPTIISRTQELKLLPLKQSELVKKCIDMGIDPIDSQILTSFYSDLSTINDIYNSKSFQQTLSLFYNTVDALTNSFNEALFYVETDVISELSDKQDLRLYVDLLSLLFKDILNYQNGLDIVLKSADKEIQLLSKKLSNINQIYLEIMLTRGKIELNVNKALILEHIFITIQKGGL